MNLIEGLLTALKAEHDHIENVKHNFNEVFDAKKRAAKIVDRLTQLEEHTVTEPATKKETIDE